MRLFRLPTEILLRRLCTCALTVAGICLPARADWKIDSVRNAGSFPEGGRFFELEAVDGEKKALLRAFVCSSKAYLPKVLDNPSPTGANLATALSDAGCVAGVNGGYFTGEFRPVGLVIANGKLIHPAQKARILSGIFLSRGGAVSIVRSSQYEPKAPLPGAALQCGPFLVEKGEPVPGLEDTKSARRTFIATLGGGRWLIGILSRVTLADAARILSLPKLLDGGRVENALNLDGGSSTGMWVGTPEPFLVSPLTPVRNYLGVASR